MILNKLKKKNEHPNISLKNKKSHPLGIGVMFHLHLHGNWKTNGPMNLRS